MVDEEHADRFAQAQSGATVRTALPEPPPPIPAVRDDDTLAETATVMDSLRSPLVAVLDAGGHLIGVAPRAGCCRPCSPGGRLVAAWLTLAVFVGVYVLLGTERVHRVAAALGGAVVVLASGVVTTRDAFYSSRPESPGTSWSCCSG